MLVDLLCDLYKSTYGALGAQIIRLLLTEGPLTQLEIIKKSGLASSAVQRTLVSLVTNRFVLFWQQKPTKYFANWRQIYAILWTGELLVGLPTNHREILLSAVYEGQLPKNRLPNENLDFLKELSLFDFQPLNELKLSLQKRASEQVNSDQSLSFKSESFKRQLIQQQANTLLENLLMEPPNSELFAVDYDKFLIRSRRNELVAFCARIVGETSSKLYDIVLKLSETNLKNVKQSRVPSNDSLVSVDMIVPHINDIVGELRSVFVFRETESAKRVKLNSGLAKNAVLESLSLEELVDKHLQLLEQNNFVQRVGARQNGEWFVNFEKVVTILQRDFLDEIIVQSLGEPAMRLLNVIRSVGKLDEKMLANIALLPALEIRHQMSALASLGFADIQELSKPSDRQTSGNQKRSLFLWYHRPKWAYSCLVDRLYGQLSGVLHELEKLKLKHQILLQKLTREDVLSDIKQFLTAKEQEELEEYKRCEHEMLVKMNMVDRCVRVFREY